ncbi:MAG: MFS transporter [Bacteroidales bacterium]|nr:MFS transporter [Bacteroidales bacterium]
MRPMKKPDLSFWQIWNLSFGFLGVQIGYALQNANTSRIFQAMGADVSTLSYFWLAAPLAGFIVQPIIGMFSDKTWTRIGRRMPYILGGAVVSVIALFLMPNASILLSVAPLAMGAIILLFMDMSFNVTMQPFRALVADMMNDRQKAKGYIVQTFLINVGAIVGAVLPYVLTNWIGLDNETTSGHPVSDSVAWSYYIGGALLIITVLATALRTKEFPPKDFAKYAENEKQPDVVADSGGENDLSSGKKKGFISLLRGMPRVMYQLGLVQFFSWASLFIMWNYLTPAIADHVWHALDPNSTAYGEAANWVGVLNGVYPVPACIIAVFMTRIAAKFGNKMVYAVSLLCGALGFLGLSLITDKYMLFLPMAGIGIAWAGILAMPYSILSKSIESSRMGVYMGIFNFTITLPQIFIGAFGGLILTYVFGKHTVGMLFLAAIFMTLAAITAGFVKEKEIPD